MPRLFLLMSLCALCGCGPGPEQPRSCVLITLDTTNPEALDMYGPQRGITPHLNRLAAEGIVFENARAVAPITITSHASMLTGLYPPRHGVRDNAYKALPQSAETLAERARDAGCRTGAFVAAAVLRATYGLDQGFDVYGEAPPVASKRGGVGDRTGAGVTADAIAWLDEREDGQPFFLWAHYFDPHAPYEAPAEFLQGAQGKPYLAEVSYMDSALGPLLKRLRDEPDYDEFTIIVVADHGESGGKHGEASHGVLCYDATLRVPLIVRLPLKARAGSRSTERASVVDVFPTALEAMGLGAPPADGLSLVPGTIAPDRGVYFECYYPFLNYGWGHLAGWAGSDGKFINGPAPEFYDTKNDPQEQVNLLAQAGAAVTRARAAMTRIANASKLERSSAEQGAVTQEGMRGMGYAGSASVGAVLPEPASSSELPAPVERLDEHYAVWTALAQADRNRKDLAMQGLQQIVDANPRNAFAHSLLGEMLLEVGKPRKAIRVLSAMIELDLDRPGLRRNLALGHAMLGEFDAALEHVSAFEAFCPNDSQAAQFRLDIEKRRDAARATAGGN